MSLAAALRGVWLLAEGAHDLHLGTLDGKPAFLHQNWDMHRGQPLSLINGLSGTLSLALSSSLWLSLSLSLVLSLSSLIPSMALSGS